MSQYKNLRRFIYLNVKAKHRGEGYRLIKRTVEETREDCAKVAEGWPANMRQDRKFRNLASLDIAAAIRRK